MILYNSKLLKFFNFFTKLLSNNIYESIMLYGFVLTILDVDTFKDIDLKHELIHKQQFFEMSFIGLSLGLIISVLVGVYGSITIPFVIWTFILAFSLYYIWYFIEFIVRLIIYKNWDKAYEMIAFEQEAYENAVYSCYQGTPFAFFKYYFE